MLPPPPAVREGRSDLPRRFQETRALWVVRGTLTHPDSVRAMVRRADAGGFNTLLVQVRGRGDAYYRSRWEPRTPLLEGRPDFDPLDLTIREAHQRGLAVHAWINTHLVAGPGPLPEAPDHLVRDRPDLLAVPRALARRLHRRDPFDPEYLEEIRRWADENREQVEGVYTNPAHPEVKEHVYAVWMDLADRYDLDGMHFDYVRYAGPEFDYSRDALLRFRRWAWSRVEAPRRQDAEAALEDDPLAWTEAFPELWDDFRREQITELVRRIYWGVKKRRPGVLVSAAVFANRIDAYRHRYQDWARWLEEGVVDVVVPMAYTADDRSFTGLIEDAVGVVGGRRVWAGIGAYRNTPEGTLRKIAASRQMETSGVVLFSYDWIVGEGEAGYLERVGEEAFGGR